jgi:hypothetical protein
MADKKTDDTAVWTLEEDDIKEVAHASRRTALVAVGAAVASALGAILLRSGEAEACRRTTGRSDSDPQDGGGHGHTGINDSDSGDEPGCGGAPRRRRPHCSDQDPNDGGGHGRHCHDEDPEDP